MFSSLYLLTGVIRWISTVPLLEATFRHRVARSALDTRATSIMYYKLRQESCKGGMGFLDIRAGVSHREQAHSEVR